MGKFNLVVCGGTFDLLHVGHINFINDALSVSKKVLLGITSDSYIQKFKNNLGVEDFKTRKKAVEEYLNSIDARQRVQIVKINNPSEPHLETSLDYDAILVTEQTKESAGEINVKRIKNGIPKLKVVISIMQKSEAGRLISSTRIRNGQISREGKLYLNPEWKNKNLFLPESLRSVLQRPWGKIIDKIPANIGGSKTITVGDATTQKFNARNIGQFLSIVDFQVQRKKLFKNLSELGFLNAKVKNVNNPHAIITPELFEAIQSVFATKTQTVILIDGEDDLAVLPVLLIAPLGFSIFYGQPNEGLVQLIVNEENKEKAYQLIKSFDKK
jgi:cytidyltransferase-like protein